MGYYLKHDQEQAARNASAAILASTGFLGFDPALLQRQLVEEGFNHLEDFSAHAKKILGHYKKKFEDELGDSPL